MPHLQARAGTCLLLPKPTQGEGLISCGCSKRTKGTANKTVLQRKGQADWCVYDDGGAAVQCFAVRFEALGFARKKGYSPPKRRVRAS